MANDEDDPFPILQLPLTMKDMVLPKLSVLDLYNLSHVSDEAKDWVKYFVRNKNYRLKVTANWNYEVSLLNSDNQGFDVSFDSFDMDADFEFYLGDFPVLAKKEVTAPNRTKIRVLTKRLDAKLNCNNAIKSFIAHLTDVFTKDVCIEIGYNGKQKERLIMNSVKVLQLNVHCFKSELSLEYSWTRIKKFPKRRRMCMWRGNIKNSQMKLLFDEWMINGTMDYFEVTKLPKQFNINCVMRGHEYTTSPGIPVDSRNYSVTRADGVNATVTFTPGYTGRHSTRQGWQIYYVSPKFVIQCQTDQKYSTCFQAFDIFLI